MRHFLRIEYIPLGLLLLLTIIIRYPLTPHEIGVDSFHIHQITNIISSFGTISWALSPLSLFGLYPFSYPTGLPVLLSLFSQITGITTEISILITSFVLAILGTLSVYIMAKKIIPNPNIAFLSAFFFSISPLFIDLTNWTATTRNLFIAFLPLFFWAVFCYTQTPLKLNKQLLVLLIIFIVLLTSHRLYFLLPFFFIACLCAITFNYICNINFISSKIKIISQKQKFIILIISLLLLFLLQFSGLYMFGNITEFYQSGALFKGTGPHILFLNFLANYCGQLGLLLPLSVAGLLILFYKKYKTFNEMLIILTMILCTSLLFLKHYMPIFLLPFISFLIALAIIQMGYWTKKAEETQRLFHYFKISKFYVLIIILILISSLVFSLYITQKHLSAPADEFSKGWLTEDTYSLGTFLKSNDEKISVSYDSLSRIQIYAITGLQDPNGGFLESTNFAYGLIDKTNLTIQAISLDKISIESNSLFEHAGSYPQPQGTQEQSGVVGFNNGRSKEFDPLSIIYNNGINSLAYKNYTNIGNS